MLLSSSGLYSVAFSFAARDKFENKCINVLIMKIVL